MRLNRVRRIAGELNRHIPILLDTKGPEIRLKDFENGSVVVEKEVYSLLILIKRLREPRKE